MDFNGVTVLTELDEMVDPEHTALIVIDMQNDLCSKEGVTALAGADLSMIDKITPELEKLLEDCRERGMLVVFLQLTDTTDGELNSPAWLHFSNSRKFLVGVTEMMMQGTWGWEIGPIIVPRENEPVVVKHRSDGFSDTRMDSILRSNGITSVIVTGVATHGCVEATVRGAADHGYYVVVAEDSVANREPELHEASLAVMKSLFTVHPVDEIMQALAVAAGKSTEPTQVGAAV